MCFTKRKQLQKKYKKKISAKIYPENYDPVLYETNTTEKISEKNADPSTANTNFHS